MLSLFASFLHIFIKAITKERTVQNRIQYYEKTIGIAIVIEKCIKKEAKRKKRPILLSQYWE